MIWLKRYGFQLLIIAVLLDFSTPYILGFFYPTLNQMTQVISLFGENASPIRNLFLVWSVLAGLLYTTSLPALVAYFSNFQSPLRYLPTLAIAFYGIGDSIFTGIFSVNPQLDYWNLSTWIHNLGSGLGYTSFLLFPLILAYLFQIEGKRKSAHVYLFFFCLNLLTALSYGLARFPNMSQGTIFSPLGFWQRISFFSNYLPILFFAYQRLLNHHNRTIIP